MLLLYVLQSKGILQDDIARLIENASDELVAELETFAEFLF